MLDVFLLLAFTRLGHERQDLLSPCAQTRPRFILSSERVFGGMEFEPMLTPREKSLLPENFPRGGSNPRCGITQDSEPKHYQRAIPAPDLRSTHMVCSCQARGGSTDVSITTTVTPLSDLIYHLLVLSCPVLVRQECLSP